MNILAGASSMFKAIFPISRQSVQLLKPFLQAPIELFFARSQSPEAFWINNEDAVNYNI